MTYLIEEDTVERLNRLYDQIVALSQGRCSDLVEVRVSAAAMSASLQRILEDDIVPVQPYGRLDPYESHDDEVWNARMSPDEGKPIEEWTGSPPENLTDRSDLIELIDPSWFFKRDGGRYKPSLASLRMARSLIPGDQCSSSTYATYFQDAAYGYNYLYAEQDRAEGHCPLCRTRQSCICETAWSLNGDTLQLYPDGWLNKNRKWQEHGLPTIGEIQAERHPVQVCLCPWEKCPVRQAAGFADWKSEFLAG